MDSQQEPLHFVIFPFMAPGHMIPLVDIALLLAQRGVVTTIITTPCNAVRFEHLLARAVEAWLPITMVHLKIRFAEAGLPEGCENLDDTPAGQGVTFMNVVNSEADQAEKLLEQLTPRPSCIISDMCLYYTNKLADKFQIPRIQFHGFCCFALLCWNNIRVSKIYDRVESNSEYFTVPDLPEKVDLKVDQVPLMDKGEYKDFFDRIAKMEDSSYGAIVNTFEGMEPEYVRLYKETKHDKVWCFGPVSLGHRDDLERIHRGNKVAVAGHEWLRWLDGQEKCSVIYACPGTLSSLSDSQLMELGLGLEESNKPFIWVVRGTEKNKEFEKWMSEDGFEERVKGRGLLIRGWAPQLLILSHPAVGGFLTHCGWNSTLEGISSGVPMITWPMFGDQFCDEKLVAQVLDIGVRIGVEDSTVRAEGKTNLFVKKEAVRNAVEKLMDGGDEGEGRRRRARGFKEMAKKAVGVGGSSHRDITLFIQDIMQKNCVLIYFLYEFRY